MTAAALNIASSRPNGILLKRAIRRRALRDRAPPRGGRGRLVWVRGDRALMPMSGPLSRHVPTDLKTGTGRLVSGDVSHFQVSPISGRKKARILAFRLGTKAPGRNGQCEEVLGGCERLWATETKCFEPQVADFSIEIKEPCATLRGILHRGHRHRRHEADLPEPRLDPRFRRKDRGLHRRYSGHRANWSEVLSRPTRARGHLNATALHQVT